jgi:hypothetical protein
VKQYEGRSANSIEFIAPIRRFLGFFFIRCAAPIGGVWITGPMVLAQHKGNERIGEAQTAIHSALPIVIEIAYYFALLIGNGIMLNKGRWQMKNSK